MSIIRLAPSDIHFSQDSISNTFDVKSRHSNVQIGKTLDDLINNTCCVADIPMISVCYKDGRWISSDNRRLWVFRKLEELDYCEKIRVIRTYSIPTLKCTSINDGESVRVRGDPGGSQWRRRGRSIPKSTSCGFSSLQTPSNQRSDHGNRTNVSDLGGRTYQRNLYVSDRRSSSSSHNRYERNYTHPVQPNARESMREQESLGWKLAIGIGLCLVASFFFRS